MNVSPLATTPVPTERLVSIVISPPAGPPKIAPVESHGTSLAPSNQLAVKPLSHVPAPPEAPLTDPVRPGSHCKLPFALLPSKVTPATAAERANQRLLIRPAMIRLQKWARAARFVCNPM